jgi:hypothetical protein
MNRRIRFSEARAFASDVTWAWNAEAPDLGGGIPLGNPLSQVAGRDLPGGLLDLGERPQAGPHHRDAHHGQAEHHDRPDDEIDADQPSDGLVEIAQVLALEQGPGERRAECALVPNLLALQPPAVVAGLAAQGHELP